MLKKYTLPIIWVFLLFTLHSCSDDSESSSSNEKESTSAIPIIYPQIVAFLPHDSTLFTEGLLIHDHKLFESTGSPNDLPQTNSTIGVTDLVTGKFDVKVKLDKSKYFGEGIVFLKNKLYQLTYKNQVGFIYDATSFKKVIILPKIQTSGLVK